MNQDVLSEMTANVWRIVAEDDKYIRAGDVIVILESMKMEIPVVAETSGTLRISVHEGDAIDEGDKIGSIETSPAKKSG